MHVFELDLECSCMSAKVFYFEKFNSPRKSDSIPMVDKATTQRKTGAAIKKLDDKKSDDNIRETCISNFQ